MFDTVREENSALLQQLQEHKETVANIQNTLETEKERLRQTLEKAKSTAIFTNITLKGPKKEEEEEEQQTKPSQSGTPV
jgi:hypothetical protein